MMTRAIGKLFMPMIQNKPIALQANWSAPSNVRTLITTNSEDFNLALHVGAPQEQVMHNRAKLNQLLPDSPKWLNQTHSTNVINWDNELSYKAFDADASITTKKNTVCVVMTADCLPILLTSRGGDFVSAIHAGWRGLNDGIIAKTIAEIPNINRRDILAFIGPAIDQECFEIGAEVREQFLSKDSSTEQYFQNTANPDKFMGDLRGIAAHQLVNLGVKSSNIYNSKICTKCHADWFYSYRATPKTGRIASLIWLE